jgi:hypothetical protein
LDHVQKSGFGVTGGLLWLSLFVPRRWLCRMAVSAAGRRCASMPVTFCFDGPSCEVCRHPSYQAGNARATQREQEGNS